MIYGKTQDTMNDRDITHLSPDMKILCREWLAQCKSAGLNTEVIVTWRSAEEQSATKAAGLSNAGAGQSPHNCCNPEGVPASQAFDFGVFDDNGVYVTNGIDPRYAQAGAIGKGLGLVWGGDWLSFKDFDHLELADWKLSSDTTAAT